MSGTTRATQALERAGVAFTLHRYRYDSQASSIGMQAAQALGEAPERVLKTLMLLADNRPACAILPCDRELSLKRAAVALGARRAEMMAPADAERVSGYRIGGISPFAQKRLLPTLLEATALRHPLVFVNAGQRGLQVRLSPRDAMALLGATEAAIIA